MNCILLIGECGVGKTWTMTTLLSVLNKHKHFKAGKVGMFKFLYDKEHVIVGVYDGSTFQGSDKLSMAVMADLDKFIKWAGDRVVILEGDRFTNHKFIEKVHPIVIKIEGNGEEGRKSRGSKQTERHLKSIKTRVSNITPTSTVKTSGEALKEINDKILWLRKLT